MPFMFFLSAFKNCSLKGSLGNQNWFKYFLIILASNSYHISRHTFYVGWMSYYTLYYRSDIM